jgi:hypothetical protein
MCRLADLWERAVIGPIGVQLVCAPWLMGDVFSAQHPR